MMTNENAICHFEIFVEEESMEAFLQEVLDRIFDDGCTFEIRRFQGKPDLLKNLPNRLRGYAKWIPLGYRIVVIVDRDRDDCRTLKNEIEDIISESGLVSRSRSSGADWQVVSRIAIEELEAWYFGDWEATRCAYPRVPDTIPQRAGYRDPDSIKGGTKEAFKRILQRHRYFITGLRQVEIARRIGERIDPSRNVSRSFHMFYNAIVEGQRGKSGSAP